MTETRILPDSSQTCASRICPSRSLSRPAVLRWTRLAARSVPGPKIRTKRASQPEFAECYATKSGASVIGTAGFTAQPAFAALANGILANAADNDDTHKRALLHTGSVVVPTALALTETEALSGQSLIVSLVAGYEVAVRVGMAVMPTHYRFWHSTGTNGTFGQPRRPLNPSNWTAMECNALLGSLGRRRPV